MSYIITKKVNNEANYIFGLEFPSNLEKYEFQEAPTLRKM